MMHRRLLSDRQNWMQRIKGEPGSTEETIGNAHAVRDGRGLIRDIEYRSGDVRFRSFEYDEQNNVRRMIVDSKTKGVQIWNRVPNGLWYDQNGRLFDGTMEVDQKSGAFTYRNNRDGQTHTFGASGKWDVPADRNLRGDGGQRRDNPGRRDDGRSSEQGDRQTRQQYERTLAEAFGPREITDRRAYRDNLFHAGADGKPVVMTFGRSSDAQSQKLIDDLKKAQAAAGNKAVFLFVDLDKFDPNSKEARDPNCPIGRYARDYIGKDWGTPLTMVFTQKQGQGRTPVIPEQPTYHVKGNLDGAWLQAAIDEAALRQQKLKIAGYEGTPQRDRLQPPPKSEADKTPPAPLDVLKAASKFDVQSIEQRTADMDFDKRFAVYQNAIQQADQTGNKDLMGRTRAMLGLATIGWATDQAAVENPDAFENLRRGIGYIFEAGMVQPRLYHDPAFRDALAHSGLNPQTTQKIIERGKLQPDWFLPKKPEERRDANKCRLWFNAAMNDLVPPPCARTTRM